MNKYVRRAISARLTFVDIIYRFEAQDDVARTINSIPLEKGRTIGNYVKKFPFKYAVSLFYDNKLIIPCTSKRSVLVLYILSMLV